MRIFDYKMYTYRVTYTYRAHVRDELGETTGQMTGAKAEHVFKVVARSRLLAAAWVQDRYNNEFQNHDDFTVTMLDEEAAPHLLIEFTG